MSRTINKVFLIPFSFIYPKKIHLSFSYKTNSKICLVFFLVFTFITKSENKPKEIKLLQIESSNNYNQNVIDLEQELNQTSLTSDERLKVQILLVTNYFNLLQYKKAAAICQREIVLAKKNNLPLNEATMYRYLGNAYYHLKQNDKAIIYWKQCLSIASVYHYYDLLKNCYHNIGSVILETSQSSQLAESYFLKAIEFGKKTPSTKQSNLANNYRLLATTYDLKGDYKKADSLFNVSYDIYKSYNDSLGLAEVLIFKARLYISMGKLIEADKLAERALSISRTINNDEHIQTALSIYEQIKIKLGDYKQAYIIQSEILNIEITKYKLNQKKEIAEAEAKFKVAELKIKQELVEAQAKQTKKNYIQVFIILFLVTVFIIIFFYQKKISSKEQELKLKTMRDIYEAEEKERTRIAKDLHDNMGAYATSILAQIDVLESITSDIQQDKLQDLRTDAEYIMATLRETIWILKTKNITANQLFDLLKTYTNKHLVKNLNIKVVYHEDLLESKTISPTISLNLYRIIQEIIQNIIKHAQATEVIFKLSSTDKINIEIIDDGVGFDYKHLSRKSGLDNIEYRANEINYHIKIESTQGKGTSFKIEEQI